MAVLQTTDVTFSYDRKARSIVNVVDSVSLSVRRGAIVGLLGPNGSGKTTLLRLLAGTLAPDRGDVRLDGQPINALSRRDLARRIAVVPQETHSAFDFSALEIVLMGRYPHLGAFELEGADDLAIARRSMAETGTAGLEDRRFAALSGGEKQRVVIAGALAQASDVLLLDEPTASLDPDTADVVRTLLKEYQHETGATILMASHNMAEVERLCDDVILMQLGKVFERGHPQELIARFGREDMEQVFLDMARGRSK
jgi:ABC-type cobalamin/Fe3+-siderophores transport system ATPase subunit